jgi:hypothetical protein
MREKWGVRRKLQKYKLKNLESEIEKLKKASKL